MDDRPILVIGGTGMLGKPVARQLKEDGFKVRLLARNPEKALSIIGEGYEIVRGDFEDARSLEIALTGCAGVHISIKGGPTNADFERVDHLATRRIAEAARAAGAGRVTLLSTYALSEEKVDTPESRAKRKGERALIASGVPYTIFRATWFMESLPLFVQGQSISLIGNQPHPLHWIASSDYAKMVSNGYRNDESLYKDFYIFGPQAFTMREAMEIYRDIAAKGIKIAPISTTMLRLLGILTFNREWEGMAVLMKHYEKYGEDGSPEPANQLLGKPSTTLEEWCREHPFSR